MTYDNSNRLAVWPNTKRKDQKHPHLSGQGETDREVWVSAWFSDEINDADKKALAGILKRYSSKKPFISVSIKPKQEDGKQAAQPGGIGQPQGFDNYPDDDIPF